MVFNDIVLPGTRRSRELAAEVRARRPGIPVVLASGWSGDSALPADVRAGSEHFIMKPYRLSALAASLSEALRGAAMSLTGV
ncbi:hypothetical protein DEM34_15540 [Spiribacter halobius]|uniref:Response regulatory domain-containing protein n=1 Tax=Sediminicurvatus halobius TaxID=2182432 RepID=A0A2U2MXI7_9GAMM|nr:hypothetical protein DEM34_15540 [Spiribacter halobius]